MHHDEISLDPNEQAAHRYCLITLLPGRDSIHEGAASRTKLHGTMGYIIQKYCLLYANPGSAVHSLIRNEAKRCR